MKLNTFIKSHKFVTGFVILGFIFIFSQWDNPTAWVYLGLHGSYGILWVLKSTYFPDPNWEIKTSLIYGVLVGWGSLTTYWAAPFLICFLGVRAPLWLISICIILYCVGIFFHFTADMQKYIALKYKPEHLVTEGIWSISRNPNYFGEFLIYISFGIISMHWLPITLLLLWIVVYWHPNMKKKDKSLSRYPEYSDYVKRTKRFLPFLY